MLGDIILKRPYYTDAQGNGYFPLDDQLGLDKDSLSVGVKQMIGHAASSLSFEESSQMICHLTSLHVGPKQIERAAEALGREIAQQEKAEVVETAPWIWNIAAEQFPDAIQIIDLYHVKGTVTNAAKAIFGNDSEFGALWAKECRDKLEDGQSLDIIAKLQPFTKKCEAAGTCID